VAHICRSIGGTRAGRALGAIRDKRLYRKMAPTFEEYIQQQWPDLGTKRYAFYVINAAKTVDLLGTIVPKLPATVRAARCQSMPENRVRRTRFSRAYLPDVASPSVRASRSSTRKTGRCNVQRPRTSTRRACMTYKPTHRPATRRRPVCAGSARIARTCTRGCSPAR